MDNIDVAAHLAAAYTTVSAQVVFYASLLGITSVAWRVSSGDPPKAVRCQSAEARLAADKPGVLKWLVDGAVKWYSTKDLKRNMPPQVKAASKEYFADQDSFGEFLSACCDIDEDAKEPTSRMLAAYRTWALDAGVDGKMDSKRLSSIMRLKGFDKRVLRWNGANSNCYVGVCLKDSPLLVAHDALDG